MHIATVEKNIHSVCNGTKFIYIFLNLSHRPEGWQSISFVLGNSFSKLLGMDTQECVWWSEQKRFFVLFFFFFDVSWRTKAEIKALVSDKSGMCILLCFWGVCFLDFALQFWLSSVEGQSIYCYVVSTYSPVVAMDRQASRFQSSISFSFVSGRDGRRRKTLYLRLRWVMSFFFS